jgi:hypothetical protein
MVPSEARQASAPKYAVSVRLATVKSKREIRLTIGVLFFGYSAREHFSLSREMQWN